MYVKSSPKVAFIATVYRHLEAFHMPYMDTLREMGYEVTAIASPDTAKSSIEKAGFICKDISFSRSPFALSNLKAFYSLMKLFKRENYRAIHVHTPVAGFIARFAAALSGVPKILYTAHGFHFYKGAPLQNWLVYYSLERISALWTDYLFTINHEDFLRAKQFPVRGDVVYLPGIGVDTNLYHPLSDSEIKQTRASLGIKPDEILITYVAELNQNKNQIQLINALPEVLAKGKKVKVFLVGSGRTEKFLKRIIQQNGLEKNIYLLGFRQDANLLMSISDIVVLLSRREGLPKCLLEAIAMGKPVLATDIRGNRDLIIHGENGFLVNVGDCQKTAQLLLNLIDNPELRFRMGAKNLELKTTYSLENTLNIIKPIYEKL